MNGKVDISKGNSVGAVTFMHPAGNSLPGDLLNQLTHAFNTLGSDSDVSVVLLKSEGVRAFCGGASFDELTAIDSKESGKDFFMGFANVILAMRSCPKPIVCRVQGKAVGGGVGLIAAADYAMATTGAALRLSELVLGLGPFVVGPAIERKIGVSAFQAMALDADWRTAEWGLQNGLYANFFDSIDELDEQIDSLTTRLTSTNPDALADLKKTFHAETAHWKTLLPERAAISGELALSHFTTSAIKKFQERKSR